MMAKDQKMTEKSDTDAYLAAIFDMRITDTECHSRQHQDHAKGLESQEKERKAKYIASYHEIRKESTPMVCSVDGITGREDKAMQKCLASYLARKWQKNYSEMVFYVKARMALSVVRANSLLLQGSRDRQNPC